MRHPDGTIELLSIHEWKTSIELSKDEYRIASNEFRRPPPSLPDDPMATKH